MKRTTASHLLLVLVVTVLSLLLCSVSSQQQETLEEVIISLPNRTVIEETEYYYTSFPHLAGTQQDYETANYTMHLLQSYGWSATIEPLTVVLSYPISRSVSIISPENRLFNATMIEAVYPEDPTSGNNDSVPTFNGYAPSGDVSAEVVYANYGTVADYEYLDSQNISVSGKIVIVRYGGIFRGTKVMLAQMHGAVGVLIYSDPADDGYGFNHTRTVYPYGIWRPESSVQRGSALFLPICPGNPIPSRIESMCINSDSPVNTTLPSIPVQPLSYGDASPILEALSALSEDTRVPAAWQGALPFTYSVGPAAGFVVRIKLEMNITSTLIWNVIATLAGEGPEADQIVMLGNHRDAWVFGAGDPVSGTVVMLETARILGQLVQHHNWKPKRTIKVASWDAEEYGLVGSTQYVEDNENDLSNKAIVYLNVDVAVSNAYFGVSATPSLRSIITAAAQQAQFLNKSITVSGNWDGKIGALGSGSDYTAFIDRIGVASVDYGFNNGPYPVYHSDYDSFHWMNKFVDPTWDIHTAAVEFLTLLTFRITDDYILSWNYSDYAIAMNEYFEVVNSTLEANAGVGQVNLTGLRIAMDSFINVSHALEQTRLLTLNSISNDTYDQIQNNRVVLNLNRLLVMTERQFLDNEGVYGRPWFRHVLQAPGAYDGYGTQIIPSVTQLVIEKKWARAQTEADEVAQQLNKVTQYIQNGISTLDKVDSDDNDSWKKKLAIALGVIGSVCCCLVLLAVVAAVVYLVIIKPSRGDRNELEPLNRK